MRKRNLILLIVFMVVIPVLLSGCFHRPKVAVLTVEFNPNQVPLNTWVTVVETLRELNGVGVSLNYFKEEWFDQQGNITDGWEREGAAAESMFQSVFGTSYIPGNGELSRSYSGGTATPVKLVRTYRGIDDNGNTVRASGKLLFGL